jgi:uncharacterized protein (TIGR02611 family)
MSSNIIIHSSPAAITPAVVTLSRHERFRVWLEGKHPAIRMTYRALIAVVGFSIVLFGIALLVLPGPGWLFIFSGLAVLGLEFHFAHRLNTCLKVKFFNIWNKIALLN